MKKMKDYTSVIILFSVPALLLFSAIVVYPIFQAFRGGMLNWDGIGDGIWVGFSNFKKLFNSSIFIRCEKNTIIYLLVMVSYMLVFGIVSAILLVSIKSKFSIVFRSAFFLPVIISTTVVCQMWLSILNYDTGLLNQLFSFLNIDYRQQWLTDSKSAIWVVAFINAWQYMGLSFMMYYTNIKSIPAELYESARLDGASIMQAHRFITLPLTQEALRFTLVFAVSSSIRAFDYVFILTNGGPGDYTNTLAYLMYKSAFIRSKYGYGCAIAVVIIIESLLFYFVLNRIIDRKDVYAE